MIVDVPTLNTIFSALLAILFWYHRTTVSRNEARLTQQEIEIQNVKMAYLHKDEFKEFKQELRMYFEDLKKDVKEIRDAS